MAAQGRPQPQPWTGIEIETSFFPMSFFLYLCTPTIIIDGEATQRPWGAHNFQLPPGPHNIRVFFRYLLMSTCGAAAINVMVQPNQVNRIKYEMGMLMFSPGTMRELPPYTFS